MATLNLSSNGPLIQKSYQNVVNSPPLASSASPTCGQWALFSVSTPLMSAFQQDTGNKESVLKVQSTGDGDLVELIDEFSEGKIQFAFVKVTDPNTGLPKHVLIAWCGEGVPERTKGYFTSHLSAVSKLLHGYHVQITARAEGDLTVEGIMQKVGDASGSKYSVGAGQLGATAPKPPVSSKPVFTPLRTGGISTNTPATAPPVANKRDADDDGWGPDAPPVTRTELEKVQPAYKPTKVNLQELRSEKQHAGDLHPQRSNEDRSDIIKGGYQPVGKVDIAAIRRQAREAGELKSDRPEPVKGVYEPVGKVDIAAIRARAQRPNEHYVGDDKLAIADKTPATPVPVKSSQDPMSSNRSERLTSLPKPKVSNKFGANQSFMGTKPPLPNVSTPQTASTAVQVGSASRTFADEGGKTPAQIWAERKARERGHADPPVPSSTDNETPSLHAQHSGKGEWKSSYNGRAWAPVQTTHTGRSIRSNTSQQPVESTASGNPPAESQIERPSVSAIRDQFAHTSIEEHAAKEHQENKSNTIQAVSLPGLQMEPTEPATQRPATPQTAPSPPPQPRSPSPPAPQVREASPIRVAMPVGRGVTDTHEQDSPPVNYPQDTPNDPDMEGDTHDIGREMAEATVGNNLQGNKIRAVVQYDYEKAEDNEIELREGEFVTEIEMVDKDWWLGSNAHGDRGLFPSNYVELLEDGQEQVASDPSIQKSEADVPEHRVELSTPIAPSPANKPSATALYDYEAAEDNELSFPEGAEITNIEFPDDDWWYGKYQNKEGLFPANYVQLVK
ncbi:hypothetical protein BDV25DRAFT_166663 [Aspergillus avenaceus]|uniref:Actin binding protein n=1 Tax=Aspergillus avenaceus TaxID=36643 RepID=A0A5N6TDR9_ASPAV|nr:hypothetical protein BDV25DRAFT_166663 [Aspergillus avenaceus]